MKITGKRIYLKRLTLADDLSAYLGWVNDIDIVQFLEIRWKAQTLDDLKRYITDMNSEDGNFLFGIFLNKSGKHIGNIKVGSINQLHRYAEIGLLIGEKEMWGKGYGSEAIKLAGEYAFMELNLNKLTATIYANNAGSRKAFLKAGYREVGILKQHRFFNGKYIDEVIIEKIRD